MSRQGGHYNQPVSYNYYHSYWLKHPVIFNLAPLPTEEKIEILQSFVEERYSGEINNYEDWLMTLYGKSITEKFHNVYTKKYWTVDAKDLSTTWIGERINVPNFKKMLIGALETETGNDYYASEMRYPKYGGYQSFIRPLAEKANIQYGKEAIRVDTKKRFVCFSDGTTVYYENLISSIPITELIIITDNIPDDIVQLASELKASLISIVSIGFNRPDVPRWLWFYIYDQDIMAARVNSPSMKSPANVPEGCSSMQFEIYHVKGQQPDKESILSNVKYSLLKMKLCDEDDIKFMDYRLVPYGNVIFFKGMEEIRYKVKKYLIDAGISLIGRFGEWDYLWSDQSYMSGINAAKILKNK